MTELDAYTSSGEIPDAIGWHAGHSVLVECKVSPADLRADAKKPARTYGPALGEWRFYFVPEEMKDVDQLPEGWGLYYATGKQIRHARGPEFHNMGPRPFQNKSDLVSEKALLLSALRRLRISGCVFVQREEDHGNE
jgi:hypothetical protein